MQKRTKKLVSPSIQLNLVGSFVGIAVVAMMLQFLFLGSRLVGAVGALEGEASDVTREIPALLLQVLAVSLVLLVPVMLGIGVVLTHRLMGPVQRMESYLWSVARGEATGPCSLRKGDHLAGLCDAVNAATEPLRAIPAAPRDEGEGEGDARQAA